MNAERKVYYSFHDIPLEKDFDFARYTYPRYPLTSKTELIHLFIAMLSLSVAFTFAMAGGLARLASYGDEGIYDLAYFFPFAVLGVLTGFFFHELSHKFVARKYGLWAEFRMYPNGLLLALIIGIFFGFVIAAPGAVNIQGGARRFELGRIASAGPLANIIVGTVSLIGYLILGTDSFLGLILGFVCMINLFLGTFNLLPFDPLDGKKIMVWNAMVWAFLFIIAVILLTIYSTRIIIPGFRF